MQVDTSCHLPFITLNHCLMSQRSCLDKKAATDTVRSLAKVLALSHSPAPLKVDDVVPRLSHPTVSGMLWIAYKAYLADDVPGDPTGMISLKIARQLPGSHICLLRPHSSATSTGSTLIPQQMM